MASGLAPSTMSLMSGSTISVVRCEANVANDVAHMSITTIMHPHVSNGGISVIDAQNPPITTAILKKNPTKLNSHNTNQYP